MINVQGVTAIGKQWDRTHCSLILGGMGMCGELHDPAVLSAW